MKKIVWCSLWMLLSVCHALAGTGEREVVNLNREWRYARGDHKGAEQAAYNDKKWESVGLPHSFSIPYFMSKDFYVGYGWYRRTLTLTAEEMKKKIFLEFDGVFQEAEVFVNGQPAATHVGGYTGFSVDISPKVKAGENLIAVRVNNTWRPYIAPRAGEHVFSGGIYRNVRLVKKSPAYIDWYGTFVTTPELKENRGSASSVQIATDVCNHTTRTAKYLLQTDIIDPKGKLLATVKEKRQIAAHTTATFVQRTKPVARPELWSPQHPALYKAVTSLYEDGKLMDRTETTFGFRWFEWSADKGFFLNGTHCYFKGVNVHQDQAGWGDAVTEAAMRRDVNMMKEAGFDLIRGSHYPHAPAFSQACDEVGMMFWSEAPFWGIGGFKADGYWNSSAYPVDKEYEERFEQSALAQLAEMIRIHRNHPSIVAWSMCNEAFFSVPEAMGGVRRLLKKMVDLSHRLDPTRPAAIGGAQRPLDEARIDLIGDIAGYNGDGATQPDFQRPPVPNAVSEYGSTTAERPGEYIPGWGDLQRNEGWKGVPWRCGQAIWCGFDHGSIAGSQLGKMGIVDYFRLPKRSWYWYRNEYSQVAPPEWPRKGTAAQLKLEASKTNGIKADGTDDVQLTVTVLDAAGKAISNSPAVQLTLLSGPGEFPTGTAIAFAPTSDIRIMDGKAAIAFRAYHAGKATVEATSPGLKPARVEMTFVDAPIYIEGQTPRTKERPYVRFVKEADKQAEQTFGRNNPAFASSQQAGHSAGMAADGNPGTHWQPDASDNTPYWILDTEKGLIVKRITLAFPQTGTYFYKVEVSKDRTNWLPVTTCLEHGRKEATREIDLTDGSTVLKGRFVRVTFKPTAQSAPAALTEVTVTGIVTE